MLNKRISIITPSLNRGDMIEASIRSVQAQGYDYFEHIIVDGGSTDRTAEVVEKYQNVKFFCGTDQGMYDALNKGLDAATGEIIGFLNTDDLYGENVFNEVVKLFGNQNFMAVAGKAIVIVRHPDGITENVDQFTPENANMLEITLQHGPYFNAWFFRRDVFDKIGNFDARYKIAGDLDFMLRFTLNHLSYTVIDQITYIYQQHEGSLTFVETGHKRIASAKEKIALSEVYLRDLKLSPHAKDLITQMHTQETTELALRSIGTLKLREGYFYSKQGSKYDVHWFVSFFKTIVISVPRYILKQAKKIFPWSLR